jgi:parvulin-like peptidyl-prolyl isomerase
MTNRVYKIAGVIVLVLIVAIASMGAWLSFGKATPLQAKILNALPYPAVFVNGKAILARDILHRTEIAKKTLPPQSEVSDQEIKQQVYDTLINEQKTNILASSKGLSVNNEEVSEQFKDAVDQLSGGSGDQFEQMLKDYGLTENEFKQQVLKPDLLTTKLLVWYNSQRNLNKALYDKIDSIQGQLASGVSFETLAAENSQDDQTKGLEGDLGFVETGKLLPEFKNDLAGLKLSETKVVASRYGVHLFKVEEVDNSGENGAARIHLKQIFLEPTGFEEWFRGETGKYSIRKFIKI